MILVCGNGSTTNTYPWECSETSCESVFSNMLGRNYDSKHILTAIDVQYCNMECYFRSKMIVSNPSTSDSPLTIYSDNSNVIECSWFVCCLTPFFFYACCLYLPGPDSVCLLCRKGTWWWTHGYQKGRKIPFVASGSWLCYYRSLQEVHIWKQGSSWI